MKRKRSIVNKNSRVRRQRDPIPWKYCVLTVVCGLILVGGFFVAAQQHFSAIGTAMDNHQLRVRISKLKDERRKLLISKERAASPSKIAQLAKKIGFSATVTTTYSSASDVRLASSDGSNTEYDFAAEKPVSKPRKNQPVIRTVDSGPVEANKAAIKQKTSIDDKQVAVLTGTEIDNSSRE